MRSNSVGAPIHRVGAAERLPRAYQSKMKTRKQIIAENLRLYKRQCEERDKGDGYKLIAEEHGQEYADKLLAGREHDFLVIRAELEKRLTEEAYLTCEDFDHFDITCCDTCHTCYPHYEMWIVVLSDGRHAWVCHSIKAILMRQTKSVPSAPDAEQSLRVLDEIFGGSESDSVLDELHAAGMAANSDEEKLYYCIKYSHHKGNRKRGHKTVETLVNRALRLPGRGPAQRAIPA